MTADKTPGFNNIMKINNYENYIHNFNCDDTSFSTSTPPKEKVNKSSIPIIENLKKLIGSFIGKRLLTSKIENLIIKAGEKKREKLEQANLGKTITITGPQNTELTGFAIKPHKETPSDKWIVVFNGMGDQFDNHIHALHQLAIDTKANILTFDYRGSGASKIEGKPIATSAADLIDDGKVVLDFVHKGLGIDLQNVMLYGHSMGGGVAARLYAETDHPGPLLSESSFSSFAAAVSVKASKIASFFLELFGWDFKALEVFEKDKDIEKKGIIVNKRDPTVSYKEASLYKKLKANLKEKPGTSILRIKIGSKTEQESLDPSVKTHTKITKSQAEPSETKPTREVKDYRDKIRNLKENHLIHLIQHPHERVMDRALKKFGDQVHDNEDVNALRAKFHKEDEAAYKAMIEMIGKLW